MKKVKFYITTTLPYVNATPHIGFALEIIQADTIARYKKLSGYEVFFNFGTDEHGQKIETIAKENGVKPKEYVDKVVDGIKDLWNTMEINIIHLKRVFRGIFVLLRILPVVILCYMPRKMERMGPFPAGLYFV